MPFFSVVKRGVLQNGQGLVFHTTLPESLPWSRHRSRGSRETGLVPWYSKNVLVTNTSWIFWRHFSRPVILPILVEITSNQLQNVLKQIKILYFNGRGQYILISTKICQRRWIGRSGVEDCLLMKWSQWSPDLSPSDFFLWGYVKGTGSIVLLFLLVLLNSSRESFPHWIMLPETCYNVFGKSLNYQLDVCCVTGGAHIEPLWNRLQNNLMIFLWVRLGSFQDNCF